MSSPMSTDCAERIARMNRPAATSSRTDIETCAMRNPARVRLWRRSKPPAPLITGEGAGGDVPIHVISGDPALLAPFRDWGLSPGMRPSGPAIGRMDGFRGWFLTTFSGQLRS